MGATEPAETRKDMMAEETYQSYEEAAATYMDRLRALQTAARVPEGAAPRRGAAPIAAEALVARAEDIAEVSASMATLAEPYVASEDAATRQGISNQMLAQAAAEMQLATELLQATSEEEAAPQAATRAARGLQLQQAISAVESAMALPLQQGLPVVASRARRAEGLQTPQAARAALEQSAIVTTVAITSRTVELGSSIVVDLVLRTEWSAVVAGASLLRQDIAEKLEAVSAEASALFKRAVTAAASTLLNVYDKIRLLLGKRVESLARQRVQEWLEQIKDEEGQEAQETLFSNLLGQFYGLDDFKQELPDWTAQSEADMGVITKTAAQVEALADQYAVFAGRLGTLQTAVVLARMVKVPQVLFAIAVIEVALLAVVVYAGADYIGYRQPRFPNMAKGVAEVIREGLAAQPDGDDDNDNDSEGA
jgi:hypothetical protein